MKNSVLRFRKIYWVFSLSFLTMWLIVSQTRLMECLTASLNNVHYVLFLKSNTIKRGDIVAIQGHREDHVEPLKKLPYSKRVLGIPGDHIVRNKDGITVIPQESYLLSLLNKTVKGKPLTPIVPLNGPLLNKLPLNRDLFNGSPFNGLSDIIPEGYLFVAGDNPQSFDSRYAEFGLVPQSKIFGKALFTW